ncbi:hypothetical protein CEY16_11395 [Halalkalibacillus sediminis]|uniref:Trigger factor C-terminal domain-containing protein n=1 Tax=Halalkalibacillus sediminis TaxID=2018042 RepID=A0A2I0QSL9_9BACI|nr:hypothetical protein CEY16_11395 [Halalkalibacillus sediminis]
MGDIRFFAEIQDEDFPKAVEAKVRETIVIQEAKKMNINVSDEVKKSVEHFGIYPPDDVDTEQANKIRDFAESQAEKFHMEPEEFHKKFIKRSAERSAYQNAFFKEHLGKPDTHEEAEEMNEEIQLIVDGLMEKHEDEIEILIN